MNVGTSTFLGERTILILINHIIFCCLHYVMIILKQFIPPFTHDGK